MVYFRVIFGFFGLIFGRILALLFSVTPSIEMVQFDIFDNLKCEYSIEIEWAKMNHLYYVQYISNVPTLKIRGLVYKWNFQVLANPPRLSCTTEVPPLSCCAETRPRLRGWWPDSWFKRLWLLQVDYRNRKCSWNSVSN